MADGPVVGGVVGGIVGGIGRVCARGAGEGFISVGWPSRQWEREREPCPRRSPTLCSIGGAVSRGPLSVAEACFPHEMCERFRLGGRPAQISDGRTDVKRAERASLTRREGCMDSSYGGTPPMGIQSIRKKSEQKHSRSFARPRQVCAARRFSSRGRGDSTASARSPRSPARSIGLEWPRPNNPGALHPPPNGQRRASWPITKLLLAQIADLADLEIQSVAAPMMSSKNKGRPLSPATGAVPVPPPLPLPLSPFPSRPSPLPPPGSTGRGRRRGWTQRGRRG